MRSPLILGSRGSKLALWQANFVKEKLEYHHDNPYGLGGDRSATNIRLMCTQHNAYMADLDYGKEKMDQYRVREPSPSFELRPDVVDLGGTMAPRYLTLRTSGGLR